MASATSSSSGRTHMLGLIGKAAPPRKSSQLAYQGGLGGVGVQTDPKVYLVLWGSQWQSDPSGEAAILESFLGGVGGSSWESSVTQYCENVPVGTVKCAAHRGQHAGNPPNQLAGTWSDDAQPAPAKPVTDNVTAETIAAAAHFGNTTPSSNASSQYVIAMATGNNPQGFGTIFCAWHGSTSSAYGDLAYTGLPYITDAGSACGANFNGLGPNAGITIVEGHELAETITDPYPNTGWLDSTGNETADKCESIPSGQQGATQNITLPTGTFPVQSLWSNEFNRNSGGCVISYP